MKAVDAAIQTAPLCPTVYSMPSRLFSRPTAPMSLSNELASALTPDWRCETCWSVGGGGGGGGGGGDGGFGFGGALAFTCCAF